jgi:hypothetical protein
MFPSCSLLAELLVAVETPKNSLSRSHAPEAR